MGNNTLVIGIGNEFRGDDGVGIYVAKCLNEKKLPNVNIMEATSDIDLIQCWDNAPLVVLIDACYSGSEAGQIIKLDPLSSEIPTQLNSLSSHDFNLAKVLELAKVLGKLPKKLLLYAIEGQRYEMGEGLSLKVREAAHQVIEQIEHSIRK